MFPGIKRCSNRFFINCVHGCLVNREDLKETLGLRERKFKPRCWSTISVLAQIAQITNMERTGMNKRQFLNSVLQVNGTTKFMDVLDQVDFKEAEELQRYIISEIKSIRKDAKKSELMISEHFREIGIAHSQYLCGNCVRSYNDMPYPTLSFEIVRHESDSKKTYAEKLRFYWEMKGIIRKFEDDSLKKIGVGVWGTSKTFVVTVVIKQSESSIQRKTIDHFFNRSVSKTKVA